MAAKQPKADDGLFVLVCVAHGHGQDWEAYCLDFDLAVQGSSLAEVRTLLEDAICDYVAAADAEDEPTRAQLLGRRAPFGVRAGWGFRFLWNTISGRTQVRDSIVGFPVSCPA